MTAVQVTKVLQPSDWQREYADFNRQQLQFLAQAQEGAVAAEVTGK